MRRFLIAGCQRSGTTMMRLILESHKNIQCVDEQYSYEMLSGRLAQPDTTGALLGFKIPVWTEQLLQAQLHWNEYAYLYGSDPVPNFYDREPIIFMVRSPFDTISSMLRLKVESDSWLQRVGVPVVRAMAKAGGCRRNSAPTSISPPRATNRTWPLARCTGRSNRAPPSAISRRIYPLTW
jgi:hypothetical protein